MAATRGPWLSGWTPWRHCWSFFFASQHRSLWLAVSLATRVARSDAITVRETPGSGSPIKSVLQHDSSARTPREISSGSSSGSLRGPLQTLLELPEITSRLPATSLSAPRKLQAPLSRKSRHPKCQFGKPEQNSQSRGGADS